MDHNAKVIAGSVGAIIAVCLLAAGLQYLDIANYRFFETKREDARREVFNSTQSFNEGMAKEIRNYQFSYIKADKEQKKMLATVILHQVAGCDTNKFPPDIRAFISQIQMEQN